jgi:hypothetical protein
VHFIQDEFDGLSKYIAAYLGLESMMGLECDVTTSDEGEVIATSDGTSTEDEVRCITRALNSDVWRTPEEVANENLYPFLVAEWNANEIYSLCADRTNNDEQCRYEYSRGKTPILKVNTNGSTFFLHQGRFGKVNEGDGSTQVLLKDDGGQVYVLTEGDRIHLSYNSSNFRNDPANINVSYYNWSAVGQAVNHGVDNGVKLSFTAGENNLTIVSLDVSDDGYEVAAVVEVPPGSTPCAACRLKARVNPHGNAVVLNNNVTIAPVIERVSHDMGRSVITKFIISLVL